MQFGKWKNGSGRAKRVFTVIACIALALAIGSTLAFIAGRFRLLSLEPRQYPQGTSINGVDIGGVTRAAAKERLKGKEAELLNAYRCTIHTANGDRTFRAEHVGLGTDLNKLLDAAFSGGEFSLSYSFSHQAVETSLKELAKSTDTPPVPPEPVPEQDAELAAKNGRFALGEGADGLSLDIDSCTALIMSGETYIEAPFVTVAYDRALAQSAMPKLISSYATSFSSGSLSAPNRVYNINKAAGLVNGAVVAPGAVFSCNDILGPRTEEAGWRMAPGITEGGADTLDQPGGGVCQVSTTLYNAVLLADMDIVCRQGHSRMVSYAEGGRDATIDTDSIDFKWKNSSSASVYVFMWTDGAGALNCELYSSKAPEYRIEIETELVETIEPAQDEYVVDYTLKSTEKVLDNEAVTGYVYDTYRVYFKDGRELKRELVDETAYNMHPRRYRVGAGYFAAMAPVSTPTPAPYYTPVPTSAATAVSTAYPTPAPTDAASPSPSPVPSEEPSPAPEQSPTAEPAPEPSSEPEPSPSEAPEP